MKRVIIRRHKWCRGYTATALKTLTGQSCCLGFVARAYGAKTPTGSSCFSDLNPTDQAKLPEKLRPVRNHDTALHALCVDLNDGNEFVGKAREREIRKELAKVGIRVIFKD